MTTRPIVSYTATQTKDPARHARLLQRMANTIATVNAQAQQPSVTTEPEPAQARAS